MQESIRVLSVRDPISLVRYCNRFDCSGDTVESAAMAGVAVEELTSGLQLVTILTTALKSRRFNIFPACMCDIYVISGKAAIARLLSVAARGSVVACRRAIFATLTTTSRHLSFSPAILHDETMKKTVGVGLALALGA